MAATQFALMTTINLLPMLSFFIALQSATLRAWERATSPVAEVGARIWENVIYIGSALLELDSVLGWIGACGEIALL